MDVRKATTEDAALVAMLVSESNKDVATKFGLNFENCPKHPSFCNEEWIKADIARGEQYFILEVESTAVGCIAFERPSDKVAYLNRLSVLPAHRRQGHGARLVELVLQKAQYSSARRVSIGIVGEYNELRDWYEKLGFELGELKRFSHLPFTVQYMNYSFKEEKLMEEINLMVMIEVVPGKRNHQIEAYKKLKPLVLAETGCLQYELFCDAENENKFILVERWMSQADLDAHDKAEHMIEADAHNPTFRAKPASVVRMKPVSV